MAGPQRKKPPPKITDYLAAMERAIRQLSDRHHLFTVFRHFVELAACLEREPGDALGRLYHRLELQDRQRGQFFTPDTVSLAVARMLVHDARRQVDERGFIRAMEPCAGSGVMVIALAHALREAGVNYQQALHVTAVDIDLMAVHMAYVQCTLLHIPALIVHGDTLRNETYSVWRTLAHVMGLWDVRLARDGRQSPAPEAQPPAFS